MEGEAAHRMEQPDRPDQPEALNIEDLLPEPDWLEWYALTPQQRWAAQDQLWAHYLAIGGSLDPEPDTQSPFFDLEEPGALPLDGRSGLRFIRRSGV